MMFWKILTFSSVVLAVTVAVAGVGMNLYGCYLQEKFVKHIRRK